MGGGEVELHLLVPSQPAIPLGLVRVQVVEDDMDLAPRMFGDHAGHEVEELDPPPPSIVSRLDQPGGDLQRSKQRGGAVPCVLMTEARQGLAVGQPQPPLRPLKGLDLWLLVHREDDRVVRWIQVQPDNVSGLLRELWIRADTPASATCQGDLMTAQHAPDLMLGDVLQARSQQRAVPARVAVGRRLVQRCENAALGVAIVHGGLATAWRVRQPPQARPGKAPAPLADGRQPRGGTPGRLLVAPALSQIQDDPRT